MAACIWLGSAHSAQPSRGKTAAQRTAQGHVAQPLQLGVAAAVLVSYLGKAALKLCGTRRLCTKGKGFAGGEAALVRQEQSIETNSKATKPPESSQ